MSPTLLSIRDLRVAFPGSGGELRAVTHGVNLTLREAECRALVGESGSGKSVTALSILDLLPAGAHSILGGSITFDGHDLIANGRSEARRLRGKGISMIFQDPLSALHPSLTVGAQIEEAVRLGGVTRGAGRRVVELLTEVGVPDPLERAQVHPHELSGGLRQRVLIAMALANDPRLLIADEPTTALDVTVQAQILDLFQELGQTRGMAVLLITHDLGVVAQVADRMAVMYAGCIVEDGPVVDLFDGPRHPYTIGLLAALPTLSHPQQELATIPGRPPDPMHLGDGCAFAPRCASATDICRSHQPDLYHIDEHHSYLCHLGETSDQDAGSHPRGGYL